MVCFFFFNDTATTEIYTLSLHDALLISAEMVIGAVIVLVLPLSNISREDQMKAAILREINTPLEIEEVQISKPGPREVLVRPVAAGVCHSDVHFMDGSYPYALPTKIGRASCRERV